MAAINRLCPHWLREPETMRLISLLGEDNCRFVGGAVRDSLLGRKVRDIDLATTLLPEDAMKRLKEGGVKVVPTGLQHGTITAVINSRHFEVTTLRHDVETDGRRAKVKFHTDWEADAARRDFTINALYLSPLGKLDDFFGGQEDLRKGLVRFIGNAGQRIDEDALRILRFFRFYAHYGRGEMDAAGLAACCERADKIQGLSVERIAAELKALLGSPDPLPTLEVMKEANLLSAVLPEAEDLSDLARLIPLEKAVGEASPIRRLAALLPRRPEIAGAAAKRLKLSKKEAGRLIGMAGRDARIKPGLARPGLQRAIYLSGLNAVEDALFMNADAEDAKALEKDLTAARGFEIPKFPVGGSDLRAMGVDSGPEMGEILQELEQKWLEGGFFEPKEAILRELERKLTMNPVKTVKNPPEKSD